LAWAIVNARGGVFYYTISDARACAIAEHVDMQRKTWPACRKLGDRAVRIRIEVLP